MTENLADIGMIGLGVMGRNLLLNMAERGYVVAGYDKDPEKVSALAAAGEGADIIAAADLPSFLARLKRPRAIMLLVPAGRPVDAVLGELLPLLERADLVIDGGNSHFSDTDRRLADLERRGLHYLGVGVSGGEAGARHGPSLMPGGSEAAWERVQPIFTAAAAKVGDDPCVTWLGPGSAGHYVKMVHNGIEYGLMQLIAESYDLLHRGLGYSNERLQQAYREWNEGPLNGYLVEITAAILERRDERTGRPLIDVILDAARQKGTGQWSSQEALELQVPVPNIDQAVLLRDLSARRDQRLEIAALLGGEPPPVPVHPEGILKSLEKALEAAFLLTYGQGLALLREASNRHGYGLDLEAVARIWRGGCIIRAALLEDLRSAFHLRPELPNLLLDRSLGERLGARREALAQAVGLAARLGIPAPGLMAALAYFDAWRSARLPTNLVQAQRDYFGSHRYERIDAEGSFHTEWEQE
jgi:6-phosphogluconate dehydrogenase